MNKQEENTNKRLASLLEANRKLRAIEFLLILIASFLIDNIIYGGITFLRTVVFLIVYYTLNYIFLLVLKRKSK